MGLTTSTATTKKHVRRRGLHAPRPLLDGKARRLADEATQQVFAELSQVLHRCTHQGANCESIKVCMHGVCRMFKVSTGAAVGAAPSASP